MKIVECPRDAMQGISDFIPTSLKVRYINQLLKVGFDTIDFGSFVSPKAIPQMKDTAEVLSSLELHQTQSKLLAIIANVKGAERAAVFDEITYLGYPLSLSETFQQRNTNRTINKALDDLAEIQEICQLEEKTLVVYLSMGFGNPYGDPYDVAVVEEFTQKLDGMEVGIISMADTVGTAKPELIASLFQKLIVTYPHIEFGAHLHSSPETVTEKIQAAFDHGCRRFDGAIRGYGGCPMAKDELVGNVATETIINTIGDPNSYNMEALHKAMAVSAEVFSI